MTLQPLQLGQIVDYVQPQAVAVPMPAFWLMVRTVPHREIKTARQLLERGLCAYLPKERRTHRSSWQRRTLRDMPIFYGTLFVPDFDADLRRLRAASEGVIGFHRFGELVIRVSPDNMTKIRKFEELLKGQVPRRRFRRGQRVRIKGGPLDLVDGLVDEIDSSGRLTVLLDFLGRMVPLKFDEDQIEAV